jgi:hypothetical protein
MPAAIDFYHDTLGSKSPPPPNPETTTTGADLKLHGVERMFNFFGCEDLDAPYRHLRANGLEVNEPKIAPYGMKQL